MSDYSDTLGGRLRELRKLYGYTTTQIGLKIDKSRSAISMWETNQRRPDYTDIVKLAEIYNVSSDFLIGKTSIPDKVITDIKIMKFTAPVYGRIPAGTPFEAIEERMEDLEIPNKFAKKKDLFGLKIEGESMNKKIPNGAIGLFEKCDTLENGEIGAIMVNGFDATVKKFYRLTDSVILEPLSYDESFEPMIIKDGTEEVRIIGKLLWFSVEF